MQHSGENCWAGCNGKQGKCDWCGTEGYCCRKNYGTISNGCDDTFGGENDHTCVLKPSNDLFF